MLGSELVLDFGLTYKGPLLLMKSSTQWHSLTVYTNQRPASMFCPVMSKSVTLTDSVSIFVSVFSKLVTSKALRQVVVTPPGIEPGFRA